MERSLSDSTERKITRRGFAINLGIGILGTGTATGDEGNTERMVVGTDSEYNTDFGVQQSDAIEKRVDLGSIGDAIVGHFEPATAAQLQEAAGIRYVEEDPDVTFPEFTAETTSTTETGTPEGQRTPWGCERIGAMSVHENNVTGSTVDIAVIDSGIDSDHPDLQENLGTGYAVTSCGDCSQEWDDDHSHGTHCAGTIGALDNGRGVVGVSPDVTLHAVKVMTAAGTGSGSDIAEGIRWATDQGCDVANISLGTDSPSEVIHDAIKYATENGMLVVAAAGNEGPCSDCIRYPGAFDETLCVGAINDNDQLAEYSSTGDAVDVVAPGTEIPSTVIDGEYRTFSGTSMASPHVVGAAAMLVNAGSTPMEVKQRLVETAEDIGLDESATGTGLVDCVAAAKGSLDPGAAVETGPVAGIRMRSATVSGELTRLVGTESVRVGAEYWPAAESPEQATWVQGGSRSAPGQFTAELGDLERDTEYRYRAVCRGDVDATGSVQSFSTRETPPEVSVATESITDVTATSVTATGELTALDGVETAAVGFEYWVESKRGSTLARTETTEWASTGTFSQSVDGLDPDTSYVLRALATPARGETLVGAEMTFTTDEGLAVEATGASDEKLYGATLQGKLLSVGRGDGQEIEAGFRYWEDGDGASEPDETRAASMTDTGAFEADVSNLDSGTTYHYVAYALAEDDKEVLSESATFTTDEQGW